MKLLLVCSSGGHFRGLQQLQNFYQNQERAWVTFKSAATMDALCHETVYWAFSPTNRHLINLVRNAWLAVSLIRHQKPDLVVSTGAGVAVPFLIFGRLFGCRTIFIESITRIQTLSLSAKLALAWIDDLYVHWPQLQKRYPQAILINEQLGQYSGQP